MNMYMAVAYISVYHRNGGGYNQDAVLVSCPFLQPLPMKNVVEVEVEVECRAVLLRSPTAPTRTCRPGRRYASDGTRRIPGPCCRRKHHP